MIHRSLRISSLLVALTFAAASLSYAQTAPAAAPATPPQSASAATPAPATTTEPAAPAPSEARPETYTLQPGDTLESIGKQWGLTGRQIQKYNKFTNKQVKHLQIGQVIKIPPATK